MIINSPSLAASSAALSICVLNVHIVKGWKVVEEIPVQITSVIILILRVSGFYFLLLLCVSFKFTLELLSLFVGYAYDK